MYSFFVLFSDDAVVRARLSEALEAILNRAQEPAKSKKIQYFNSKNSVLFEAINLILHFQGWVWLSAGTLTLSQIELLFHVQEYVTGYYLCAWMCFQVYMLEYMVSAYCMHVGQAECGWACIRKWNELLCVLTGLWVPSLCVVSNTYL